MNVSTEMMFFGFDMSISSIWNSLLARRMLPDGELSSKDDLSKAIFPQVSLVSTSADFRVIARTAASSSFASNGLVR